jgi:hypothetical protein
MPECGTKPEWSNAGWMSHRRHRLTIEFIVGMSMSKAVGGGVWSELKGTDSEKLLPLMDEGRVPDFFDRWMEEYISKVGADQPGIGQQTPSTETRPKPMKKTRAETATIRSGKDERVRKTIRYTLAR